MQGWQGRALNHSSSSACPRHSFCQQPRRQPQLRQRYSAGCTHASSAAGASSGAAGESASAADSTPGSPARLQRKLSMKQKWRVFKYEWRERQDKAAAAIMATPPAQTAAAGWGRTLAILNPVFVLFSSVQHLWTQTVKEFYAFTMEETRRKWKWERMHEHHFTFWTSALKCAVVATWTIFFQIVTPPIFIWAVPAPMFCLWTKFDEPEGFAIALALLVTLPLKFFPGSGWRWFV